MPWGYALGLCFECVFWVYNWAFVLGVCFGPVFWAYVLGVCFGRMLWAYALGVYFKCMALERMALGASLWVRGFGSKSLGIWILLQKPEAKD